MSKMSKTSEVTLSLIQVKAALDVKDYAKARNFLDIVKKKVKGAKKVDVVLLDKLICKLDEKIAEGR
jgi:hypothetical protein